MPSSIKRVFVGKKPGFDVEAGSVLADIAGFLGVQYGELGRLKGLRLFNRYDVGRLDGDQFRRAVDLVLSETQCDRVFYDTLPLGKNERAFAVEYLAGQYDQRADSAEQCAELVTGIRPVVRSARVFVLEAGAPVSDEALEAVKRYLINPVDSREAGAGLPLSLEPEEQAVPDVPVLEGFICSGSGGEGLAALCGEYGLAMSPDDLRCCRDYFQSEGRDPSLAELRILDTYWSDHCRHTTFNTVLERIDIEAVPGSADSGGSAAIEAGLRNALSLYGQTRREVYGKTERDHGRTLMDMATIGARALKRRGLVPDLDESKEINACTVKVDAEFSGGETEPWLLLFKNETHNHPTEIEPFGGAATCLGGAIRDPLSGRAFVHQAMRVSAGGDPRQKLAETLPGKLPQVKIAREAAAGYSSYGNQIGLATGQVAEFYHPGFTAKRMELGAVIGAVPASWVRREEPEPGDLVLLVGGKTGRDGIGGATGSSKAHTGESVENSGAEVQKGNAVEERKLQRLFRRAGVARLIKRCNDFGAGGVSVAVGELADGLDIDLDAVPKKYAGLDGTELAVSESQERMAVVTAPCHAEDFIREAAAENLTAVVIAKVTSGGGGAQLRMFWRGKVVADLSRSFLNTNGAGRSAAAKILVQGGGTRGIRGGIRGGAGNGEPLPAGALLDELERELASLRSGSRRGLQERFDGSIGASSVLFPWGGRTQGTAECGMAALLPSLEKQCVTASLLSFGYDPEISASSPYLGAKGAIREALAKFACMGGDPWKARLSLQEYFERAESGESWGKPAAALLGALEAQLALGVPAIGGKDSMSGTYRDESRGISLAVPPTLAAFAAGTAPASRVRSGALSGKAGNTVLLLAQPDSGADEWAAFRRNMDTLSRLAGYGIVRAAYPAGPGGTAASLAVMAFGNMAGLEVYADSCALTEHDYYQGSILAEIDEEKAAGAGINTNAVPGAVIAARTLAGPVYRMVRKGSDPRQVGLGAETGENPEYAAAHVHLAVLRRAYEYPLAQVYPQTSNGATAAEESAAEGRIIDTEYRRGAARPVSRPRLNAAPLVTIPAFPGTNCEWDMERAFREAGARTRILVFRNRRPEDIPASIAELAASIRDSQIVALSGGFSAGDEPDGSGKFIANVFRSRPVADAVADLLENQDGLVLGICNGFQALIKLGLVPYGRIQAPSENTPTLTFNSIGRHVSRMVRTRVMSDISPWLALEEPGALHVIPVSHGEGRVVIQEGEAEELFRAGQIACCYADPQGRPTLAEPDNPNGSQFAIEAMSSPDGRVLGKMAHSERRGEYVHINIPGNKNQRIFEAGVRYFC
ncbi:MAG: phosphoribosylformylglycinamidine synthase [Treponema sp.]|jgi:phosphoribosylformylglycinamidine synthase|nr:phosphoribosylformylglycinamidine synthase [Treponema sp.]